MEKRLLRLRSKPFDHHFHGKELNIHRRLQLRIVSRIVADVLAALGLQKGA